MSLRNVSRRRLLRTGGVALALPTLDLFSPRAAPAAEAAAPRRMIFVCCSLGLHGPHLFPKKAGLDHEETAYLKPLQPYRGQYTLFGGLSHPDQAGADGHSSEVSWLTGAHRPGLAGFRNSISVDQLAAEKIGFATRFPTLALATSYASGQSHTRSGAMVPAMWKPGEAFAKLFLAGKPEDQAKELRRLREGRSILDAVGGQAKQTAKLASAADREKLDEYFQSLRELETRLAAAEGWSKRPKPKLDVPPPQDVATEADMVGRMRLMFELIPLALRTDSTRIVTLSVQGRNDVPPVPGVSIDHHNLSHHGQDPAKLAQLRLIEEAELKAFAGLLAGLAAQKEAGGTVLDRTATLFGSNLGNANAHDVKNLPILVAGGGFKHRGYVPGDAERNAPLGRLFVSMLQRFGLGIDEFAGVRGPLPGFNLA